MLELTGSLDTERRWRVGLHRQGLWGEVLEVLLEGNQEGIRIHDFEGGGGGRWSHVGNSNVVGNTNGYIVANVTLRFGA